jgi:hypothetical protein
MHTDFSPVHVEADSAALAVRETDLFSACVVTIIAPNTARVITVIIN